MSIGLMCVEILRTYIQYFKWLVIVCVFPVDTGIYFTILTNLLDKGRDNSYTRGEKTYNLV